MGVLADYLQTERDQLREVSQRRAAEYAEWVTAMNRLIEQTRRWLTEADGVGLLRLELPLLSVSEPRLGTYEINGLAVQLNGRRVVVAPRARYVVARIHTAGTDPKRADGMVELRDGAAAVYYLFRLKSETGDGWYIQSVDVWNNAKEYGLVEPLDRDRFEAAVLSILQ